MQLSMGFKFYVSNTETDGYISTMTKGMCFYCLGRELSKVAARVPNRPSGLTSFGAPHRRPDRVNSLFALGRLGPRIESLGLVQQLLVLCGGYR